MLPMYKLIAFLLCVAFLVAAGGAVGAAMALGVLAAALGALTLMATAWKVLSHQ